jgi:hypothetical protein
MRGNVEDFSLRSAGASVPGFILIFIDNEMERLVQGKRKKKGRWES